MERGAGSGQRQKTWLLCSTHGMSVFRRQKSIAPDVACRKGGGCGWYGGEGARRWFRFKDSGDHEASGQLHAALGFWAAGELIAGPCKL